MDYTNPNAAQTIPQEDINRGKTIAILAYCTLIGFIIAIIMHQSEKTKYGAFHIRQALGLFIFTVGSILVIAMIGWIMMFLLVLIPVIQIALIVFIILGIVNSATGKVQGLPLIGKLSDKMLSGIQ